MRLQFWSAGYGLGFRTNALKPNFLESGLIAKARSRRTDLRSLHNSKRIDRWQTQLGSERNDQILVAPVINY
jgi:hypothetical protein